MSDCRYCENIYDYHKLEFVRKVSHSCSTNGYYVYRCPYCGKEVHIGYERPAGSGRV